eukprot:2384758-Rhodomonas_salina.4
MNKSSKGGNLRLSGTSASLSVQPGAHTDGHSKEPVRPIANLSVTQQVSLAVIASQGEAQADIALTSLRHSRWRNP